MEEITFRLSHKFDQESSFGTKQARVFQAERNSMKCGEVRGQGKFKDYQYIRVMQGEDGGVAEGQEDGTKPGSVLHAIERNSEYTL